MPFKANPDRRHHIPKQKHRVTNWAVYDAGLRARGSLIVWFTPEAVAAWAAAPRTTRGGQPSYSDLAIATALTLRTVFRLALRQTEGLIGSVLQLLGLDLPAPDHSTLSRRAATLEVPRPKAGSAPVHLLVDSTGLKCQRRRNIGAPGGVKLGQPASGRLSLVTATELRMASSGVARQRFAAAFCSAPDDSSRRSSPGYGRGG